MTKPTALRGNVTDLLTRYQDLAAKEMEHGEMNWWWLSFSSGGIFLCVVVVYAHGLLEAVRICHEQNLSPGGEVLGASMPLEKVPPDKYRYKILSEHQARECMPGLEKVNVHRDDRVEPEP